MNIIELHAVKKYFSSQKAVDDISLTIEKGSIFGLLGPNGAGKTTLIRMMTGIFYPDQGELLFDGRKFNPQQDVVKIGYMPEERGLYKKMKIGEHAIYLARLKGMSKADAVASIKKWFIQFEMESWWNKKVEDLSKGMSQKLQFVTTILHNPSLIILDEPFSGLDPVNANLIKEEIFKLSKSGATIIFSTHRMEQVEEICNQIVLIDKGKKILDGTIKQVKQDFKENVFKIGGNILPEHLMTAMFEVIKLEKNELLLKLSAEASNNDLLNYFMRQGVIIDSFNEVLPSLNDIFIKLVEHSTATRKFEKTN